MKTAQELHDYIKKNSTAHVHQMAAMQLAYDHTFAKGYNPEAMEDLIKTLALCYATTEDFVLINAIKSCLEQAKLK